MNRDAPPAAAMPRRNPLVRLLASIWFGITLLTLILIYSSVISAFAPVRWELEMTEMQAFQHWFFVTLALLFVLSLCAVSLLRTRWTWLSAGGLMAHLGLLILTGGALTYFGSKIEGNVLLESPAILIRTTGGTPAQLVARFPAAPQEEWVGARASGPGPLQARVTTVDTDGPEVRGATLAVRAGDSAPHAIKLTAAPGEWQPLDDGLEAQLAAFPPQSAFYDQEAPALFFRNLSTRRVEMRPVHGLPIYHERYRSEDGPLRDSAGREVPSRRPRPELRLGSFVVPTGWFERWRMPIAVDAEGLPFTVRITGYVPSIVDLIRLESQDNTPRIVPVLAPRGQRRMDIMARAMSAIQVEIRGRGPHAALVDTQWLPFSVYPDLDAQALDIALPGTEDVWQMVYSRVRYDLGGTLAARRLWVEYFPGLRGIESYHSEIMLQPHGGVPRLTTVETNHTRRLGPWTLYQSGFAEDGWSYSILGVGNRAGMLPMNVGWVLVTLGCLHAFYLKPYLQRRARTRRPHATETSLPSRDWPGKDHTPLPVNASAGAPPAVEDQSVSERAEVRSP